MDPISAIGLVASIAQLADLAASISGGLYIYFRKVKQALKRSDDLRKEVLILAAVLEQLKTALQSNPIKNLPSQDRFMESVSELLKTMNAKTSRLELNAGVIGKRLIWPFTQKEEEECLSKIERYKSTFNLLLQSAERYTH